MQAKLFAGFHDAIADCRAVAALLALQLPSTRTAMQELLAEARRETIRIYATGAPYACKEALRENGYRWSSGEDGCERAWFKDVEKGALLASERACLTEILGPLQTPNCLWITAWNRFVP